VLLDEGQSLSRVVVGPGICVVVKATVLVAEVEIRPVEGADGALLVAKGVVVLAF
jgi:hypothetical protein